MTDRPGAKFRALYKKLVGLYPRAFRERFGESMMQTFDDLWQEQAERSKASLGFALRIGLNTGGGIIRERLSQLTQRRTMNETISNSRRAALLGFILTLPLAIMFFLFTFGIEPPFAAWLDNPDPDEPDVIGSLIVLVLVLLLPVALFINLRPIRQNVRAGNGIAAAPVNLVLVIGIALVLAGFVGHIIVDQYPCWIGVPNCD
jgi:hypothetical protein